MVDFVIGVVSSYLHSVLVEGSNMQDLNVKKPQGQTNTILSCYKGHCFGNLIRIFFFFFNEGKDLTLLYSAFLTAKE